MTLLPVIAASAALLFIAYLTVGRLIDRWLDDALTTPAVELDDGNDLCPFMLATIAPRGEEPREDRDRGVSQK